MRVIANVVLLGAVLLAAACAQTDENKVTCQAGESKCAGTAVLRCTADGSGFQVVQDCAKRGLVCDVGACRFCAPGQLTCQGPKLLRCNGRGTAYEGTPVKVCDANKGEVCSTNFKCENACELARKNRSYVGCEYWAVDLDNAVVSSGSAARQQFAVVLSNPSALPAKVTVSVNDAKPGAAKKLRTVTTRTVAPQQLAVIQLPAREVDGSPKGEFNTGTGTALTSNAYRITSSAPLVAYQFNPLSNAGVFSNDASLLIPTAALTRDQANKTGADYKVMGWPQTIAKTSDPKTNFGSDLRAFLTIVGTRDGTTVTLKLSTKIVGDGKGIAAKKAGETLTVKLGAFDVLNLETGGFGPDGDFTGTFVDTDKPVVVFSGSEASDVPDPPDLTLRRCCADHLEQQLFPTTTLGKSFIALVTPSRTKALAAAGAKIKVNPKEKDYFRVLSTGEITTVTTNLPKPFDKLAPFGGRKFARLWASQDFVLQASHPVVMGQFVASQQDAGIPSDLPGGDPAFILLPPVEQFRKDYLFLTPDKYSFDFILVAAPKAATVRLDGRILKQGCDSTAGKKLCCTVGRVGRVRRAGDKEDTEYTSYKCQLSFPRVNTVKTPPDNLEPGSQNDGVHRLTATAPAGLVVYGFDAFVSYGYPGGTDLALINLK